MLLHVPQKGKHADALVVAADVLELREIIPALPTVVQIVEAVLCIEHGDG